MKRRVAVLVAAGLLVAGVAAAILERETISVEVLPEAEPHWVWINDVNGYALDSSRALLFDADTGDMLGMIHTGVHNVSFEIAPDRARIYLPETYYPRGTRGDRTDFLIIRDMKTLNVVKEIPIPPKRATGASQRPYSGISDDGRFVYVVNITPAFSMTIVDVEKGEFVGEVETAGCTMLYPTGDRSFASLCANGTVQQVVLDENGKEKRRMASPVFFDPRTDPVREGGARDGNTWYFAGRKGHVYPVKFDDESARPGERWSLLSNEEREEGWQTGGMGVLAIHEKTDRLFAIVHKTDEAWAHKNPGTHVWVYDLKTRKRIQQIEMDYKTVSIAVSQDDEPLLFANSTASTAIMVHDARSGEHLRNIEGPPFLWPHSSYPLAK